MSWLPPVLAGIVSGLAGAALTMMASNSIIRLFRISSFEGASGYFVVFILLPLGFLVGLVTGIVVLKVNAPIGLGGFVLHQVLAILVTAGLLTAGYSLAFLSRGLPPRIEGAPLSVEVEVRYRPTSGEDPRDEIVTASLYATDKDNHYLEIDPQRIEERDGWVVAPCIAPLGSRSATRILTVTREDQGSQPFRLPFAAVPTRADTAWSEWQPTSPAVRTAGKPVDPARACEVRFRLHIGT